MHLFKILLSFFNCDFALSLRFIVDLRDLIKELSARGHATERVYFAANFETAMINSALDVTLTKGYMINQLICIWVKNYNIIL